MHFPRRYTHLVTCCCANARVRCLSWLPAACMAVVGSVCILLGGCGRDANAGIHSNAAIVIAVDTSLPGKNARDWQTADLESIEKSASEAHYLFDLWSYSGASCKHIWGPSQPLDYDQTEPASGTALAATNPTASRSSYRARCSRRLLPSRNCGTFPLLERLCLQMGLFRVPGRASLRQD